jgi:uncharacterized protein YodC (DUF2158 family)
MPELKVGDVVQLKLGGPRMTIANTKSNPAGILSVWFDEAEAKSSRFPPETLEPVKKTEKKSSPKRPRRRLPLDALD